MRIGAARLAGQQGDRYSSRASPAVVADRARAGHDPELEELAADALGANGRVEAGALGAGRHRDAS